MTFAFARPAQTLSLVTVQQWATHVRARGRDRANLDLALAEAVPDVNDDVQAWMTAQRIRLAVSTLPDCEQLPIR